jgi:hypothetical protein
VSEVVALNDQTPGGVLAEWLVEAVPLLISDEVSKLPKPKDGRDGRPGTDGKPGRDGQDGAPGVGIDDIKAYGQDMLVALSDGTEKRFRLPGGGSAAFGGGGGGGASTLAALTDTDVAGAVDGQKLMYDGGLAKWVPVTSATVTVSATAPLNPRVGDLWIDIS